MKKYFYAFILYILTLEGCNEKKDINNFFTVELNTELKKIMDNFCKEATCKDCFNEIFIDRIRPDSTIFTVRTRGFRSIYYPVAPSHVRTTVNECVFHVYTGAEEFIVPKNLKKEKEPNNSSKKCSQAMIIIIESKGKYLVKNFGTEPFLYPDFNSLPDSIKFIP